MDESLKQRLMAAAVGFCLTCIAVSIYFNLAYRNYNLWNFLSLAIVLGAVVGGVAYGIAQLMQK